MEELQHGCWSFVWCIALFGAGGRLSHEPDQVTFAGRHSVRDHLRGHLRSGWLGGSRLVRPVKTRVVAGRRSPGQWHPFSRHSRRRVVAAWAEATEGRLGALDAKTIRRSFDHATGKKAVHMVSAWCEANHLVLGQLATEEKSNEITAIPRLLEMLDVRHAVVTIDAMGCQKAIAEKIIEQQGHYVLQLKENQPTLHELVKETFDELTGRGIPCVPYAYHEETNAGHGRIETRRIWTTDWPDWDQERGEWGGLKSFGGVGGI